MPEPEKVSARPGTKSPAVVYQCFFFSGFSTLILELVWGRQLVHILGSNLYALSAVLALFMSGLSLGAYLAGHYAESYKQPLKVYGRLSLCIAFLSALITFIFSGSSIQSAASLFQAPGWSQPVEMLVCGLLILIATIPMGATFPVLCRFAVMQEQKPQRPAAWLYALNTLGAFVGTTCGGFLLLPQLGLSASGYVAVILNCLVALAAFNCPESRAESIPVQAAVQAAARTHAPADKGKQWLLLTILFLTGFEVMILEVAWSRFFCLVMGSSTYALSTVLACVLMGLALGSTASVHFSSGLKHLLLSLAAVQFLAAVYIYGSLWFCNHVPLLVLNLEESLSPASANFFAGMAARALVACAFVFIPCLLMGTIFPLVVLGGNGDSLHLPSAVGRFYAVNSAGAILGALAAGFWLIPELSRITVSGMQSTIILAACLQLLLAALAFFAWAVQKRKSKTMAFGFCLAAVIAIRFLPSPPWNQSTLSSGIAFAPMKSLAERRHTLSMLDDAKSPLLFYREGMNTTVTVSRDLKANITYLKSNGKVEASVPFEAYKPAAFSDLSTQVLLGALPVMLHDGPLDRVLIIGYGSGTTCAAVLKSPEVKNVVAVELEALVPATDRFFRPANGNPLCDNGRRLSVKVADGRNYLLNNDRKYDLIACQPADPWVSGESDLFTVEFFKIARSRLSNHGMFSQWIQLYGISPEYLRLLCRSFQSVFPETYVIHPAHAAEIILLGVMEPLVISREKLALGSPDLRRMLIRAGCHNVDDLLATMVMGPPGFDNFCHPSAGQKDNRLNTDDNLLTEYVMPGLAYGKADMLSANLKEVVNPAFKLVLGPKSGLDKLGQLEFKAQACIKQGQLAGAIQILNQALLIDPLRIQSWWLKAQAEAGLKNYPQAESSLNQVLQLDPNYFEPRLFLGEILCKDAKDARGLDEIVLASRADPYRPEPYLFIIRYFIEHGNWDLALRNLNVYEKVAGGGDEIGRLRARIEAHLPGGKLELRPSDKNS